ncbi:PREDICTED: la-related protein 1 isoform X3 [Drosophila arizonae]|uniref:La-related protein 1 isoform X3 n=1 Tax=Drosophila arizonae TaxID=7263 RepID=A0ABM1Q0W5_DROAR|nr:PREDICTED: la-related protein 1 isoform X3 [Drosophila arizonae]
MSSSSSKDDATASNAGAVTVAAVAAASAAATASYANVVQNLDNKKAAVATATATATAAAAATVDNKENQPNLKTLKSWSEETAAAEAAVEEPPTVGEKRAAAGGDNTAENSSELDDNNDFLPVLSSHHRRDRKKARKDKPTPREYRDKQQPSAGGSGSGPVQGQGQKSAAGRRLPGGIEADGRKHMARQRMPRGNSPRKNVGAPGASTSGSANVNGKTQKERKSDTSPSASLEANNSGNEAKAGDTDAQAAASTAASPAAPQPKRFIAAPPPKVNAWKISTKQVGSPKAGSSPLDKRVLQPKAQQQSKQTGSSNSNNNNNNSNKKTQQQQQPQQQQQQQQLKQVQQQQGAAAQTAIKTTTITATATTEAGATVAAAVVAVTATTTKEAVSTNVDASIADALVGSVVKDKRKVNQKASDFSNVGEWPTLIGGVSGSGKATVNEPKRNATKKQPVAKAATAAGVAAAGTASANQPATSVTTAAAATSSDSNAEPNVTSVATSSSSNQAQNATVSTSQDAKSQREAEQPAGSAAVPATGALAGAAINKKIPKHKWRPLQIDLAKSSRPKPIGGRPNRRFSDDAYEQRRPPRAYHERAGPAGARGSEGHAGSGGPAESRPHGGRYAYNARTSAATERVDSWRSSGPSAAVYDEQRPGIGAEGAAGGAASTSAPGAGGLRGPRRFRTPYRGGRQGRGGFTRPGPGRPTNRIPRHLLASGEYANYLPADAAGADSSQSYVLMGTHYFGNVPAAYIEMDATSVKEAIKKQVEYYFSADNLTGDFFLRRKMDPEGYIPVTLIASFHRVLALTTDVALIVTAIKESDKLELFEGYKVRTKTTPTIWPISDIIDEADKSKLQPKLQQQQPQQQQKQQPETVTVEEPVLKKTEKAENQTEPVKEAVQPPEASVATLSSTPPPPVILSPAMATRPLNSIPPPPVPRNSNLVPQMLLEKQRPTIAAINSVDAISALTQRVEGVVGQKAVAGAAAELADHLSGLAESVKPKSSSTPEKRTAAKAAGAGEGDGVVAALVAEPEGMWKELLLRHPLSAMPKKKN